MKFRKEIQTMAEFGKINPEKAQAIIKALKDGKINANEMKQLGLTAEEARMLNEAFSSGEVQIGDFVLINKGKSKDGKLQYTQTKKVDNTEEEPGFWGKAGAFIKRNFWDKPIKTYSDAWNKSNGFIETTGSLIGATTKTVTEGFKDSAKAIEKGTTEITGSETVGKIAKYATGIGVIAGAAEAIEAVGDWSSEKIRAKANEYTGADREILLAFADFVDEMNAADIALMFVGGAGAVKGFKELPKVVKLLGLTGALAACSVEQNVTANLDFKTLTEAINALKAGQDVTNENLSVLIEENRENKALLKQLLLVLIATSNSVEEIKNKLNGMDLQIILDAITENNKLLNEIKEQQHNDNEAILEAIYAIQISIDDLSSLIKNLPTEIKNQLKGDLEAILNAIKNGNKTLSEIKDMIKGLATNIEVLMEQGKINNKYLEDIKAILQAIQTGQITDTEILLRMLKLLKNIDFNVANLVDLVKEQLGVSQEILDKINAQGEKADKFYAAVLEALANLGNENKAYFTQLLQAIVKNGCKLDDITALLNAINKNITDGRNEAKEIGKQVIAAINKLGVDMSAGFTKVLSQGEVGIALMKEILDAIKNLNIGDGSNTEAALKAILEAINGNTQELKDITKLLNTINSNVVNNGNITKEMGEKIIEAINKLGNDVVQGFNTLIEQGKLTLEMLDKILDAIGNLDANTQAKLKVIIDNENVNMDKILEFLAKIEKNGSETNVKLDDMNVKADAMVKGIYEILAKLDDLKNGILNEILVKIEDHDVKVTVDVTGNVECQCTCGGHSPNEGIITELNDIFG